MGIDGVQYPNGKEVDTGRNLETQRKVTGMCTLYELMSK